jgi:phosphatidylserine/phosphatidylglycerophosphate/cardiolipin synthase-like enzyme
MIVDDVWVSIGSMNCNRRSMTHDTEIGIAVIDSQIEDQACVFARNLRRELWREHLCLEDGSDIPIDPIQAFDLWRSRTTDPSVAPIVHAVGHRTPPGRFNIQDSVIWNQIGDPQGVCSDQLWIPPS